MLFICVDLAKWVNLNKYRPWAGLGMHDIIMLNNDFMFFVFSEMVRYDFLFSMF